MRIDLNCDLGESFGRYTLGLDDEVIPLISSCNIACGMHAGDPVVMRRTVARAKEAGCSIGAHPGYPDLQGFGRRNMALSPDEAYSFVLYQVGALDAFCRAQGVRVHHVKPHGQLYNQAAVNRPLADAIAQAVYDFDPDVVLVGLSGGQLIEAGKAVGLRTAGEFFIDRAYTDEGTLVPRAQPGAVLTDEDEAISRFIEVIRTGVVSSLNGVEVPVNADTACVHGDNAHALEFVKRCRAALVQADVKIMPVCE
jgi:UPF0271 protein